MLESIFNRYRLGPICGLLALGIIAALATVQQAKEYLSGVVWPEVKVIQPGTDGGAPSDAIVLFDGKDMSQWNGGEKWEVASGIATAKGGGISTKESFGDCQLHLEWATPDKVVGTGQGRGNSGVYFMGKYEVQILDSYDNSTYPDGQAGAIYKQQPPLVNASRQPGQWQSYDIIFAAPRFDKQGKLTQPASLTVLHNGVLIQNHFELTGGTFWDQAPSYTAHLAKLPVHIQYHGNPVRIRNVWIREL